MPTDYGRVPPRTTLYTLRTAEARGARGWQPSGLVDWTDITRAIDGADTTATLQAAGLDGDRIAEEHFADIVDRFGPGTRVRITAAYGKHGEEILFEGFCQPVTIRWAPMRQTVMVTALDAGQEYLRCGEHQQITGRYLRRHPERAWDQTQPDHVCCTALPVTFNPSLLANREPEPCVWVMPDDYMCQAHLWTTDGHPDAQRWTYLQALRTLCLLWGALTTCPVSVLEFLRDTEHLVNEPPNANAEDPLVARLSQYIEDGACQSMSLADAIATLCEQAGLHHEVALRTVANSTPPAQKTKWSQTTVMPEHYLRIWATPVNAVQLAALPATERRMGDPAAHDLPRAAPFAEFGDDSPEQVARQIAAVSATITSDPREITAAVYLGGQQEIEVSLLLRPGWPPHQYLDAPLTATERAEAREYWTERFNPEYETTLGGRRPRSQYHGQHPNHAAVADVGRLWIFPDDPRTIDAPALARGEDTIWGWLWDAVRYAVYQPAPLDYLLWWEHPTLGGGISPGLAAEMVPARRPFGPTISRKSDATTDTSPIVRVHFGRNSNGDYTRTIPEPNDAGWVEFAGQVEISADRAAIRLVDDNLLSAPAVQRGSEASVRQPARPRADAAQLHRGALLGAGDLHYPARPAAVDRGGSAGICPGAVAGAGSGTRAVRDAAAADYFERAHRRQQLSGNAHGRGPELRQHEQPRAAGRTGGPPSEAARRDQAGRTGGVVLPGRPLSAGRCVYGLLRLGTELGAVSTH